MKVVLMIVPAALIALGQALAVPLADASRRVSLETTDCPADTPKTRRAVMKFVTSPQLESDRSEIGLGNPDTTAVRVLADSTDAAVCQWLNQNAGTSERGPALTSVYYEVDGFYVVASAYDLPIPTRFAPLAVFDSSMTLRKVVAM